MKFKDLKIGEKFTRKNWSTVDIKIGENGKDKWTHMEVGTDICANFVNDDDDVIKVED